MKYFTAELLDRFGSDDDAVADQAQADWERASDQYLKHYKSIEPALPERFKEVIGKYALHDARVFSGSLVPPFFFLTLQLDVPPHDVLLLQYNLVKPPTFLAHGPVGDPCPYSEWLYDEVYVRKAKQFYPYFEHQVLLTNGHELHIPFTHFDYLVQSPLPSVWFSTQAEVPGLTERPEPYRSAWTSWAGGGWQRQHTPDKAAR